MKNIITSEVAVAYSYCSRKAFLLLSSDDDKEPHEYVRIIENQAKINLNTYLNKLKQNNINVDYYDPNNIKTGRDFLIKATLKAKKLESYCDVLMKIQGKSSFGKYSYEPMIVVGTHSITKEQKIKLAFVGHILGHVQNKVPVAGTIIVAGEQTYKLKLDSIYKKLRPIIQNLEGWIATSPFEPPPVILNKHCPYCQFRKECKEKAEKDDDLSLLDHTTPKLIQKYHKKGIFTVKQLSYLFKPRRNRKRTKKIQIPFKPELQALAIRTGKIYIQKLPELPRNKIELFLDIEGIPDRKFYYLMGLLICENDNNIRHTFWANSIQDEERIWNEFLEKADRYPEAPIYHYGSYEPKAIDILARRYETNCDAVKERLININSVIYSKVYFPLRSNSLKEVGKFLGAHWTSPNASGLQSLVWRHQWEVTPNSNYKEMLVRYNEEDCRALQLLVENLTKLREDADSQNNIDFADQPKQSATEIGREIHSEFEQIIRSAYADYDKNKISIRSKNKANGAGKKMRGAPKGHQAYNRIVPSRAGKIVIVPMEMKCPIHREPLHKSKKIVQKTIIDLHFTKSGCRKTITKYVSPKGYCQKCGKYYFPLRFKLGYQLFGHSFQAWTIYQRIILRLPYRIITQVIEDLFGERASEGTILNFMRYFAEYYATTEKNLVKRILESPFIHVDETRINIQGAEHYVWVFTDGKHVVFRITETRETTLVHEFLSNYKGILISDFYPGYDSVMCKQQKCWAHLIRDINDDLWSEPFNTEFEAFILEVKNLIMPIFDDIKKYGLKKIYLNKYNKSVENFYKNNIIDRDYTSDLTIKYQKRFQHYKESLFTFLEYDSIPWNNNMAERAIRQLAIQRKISGTFFEHSAPQYLQLLGIAQTCRFQNKSFLKFLLSEKKDVDEFKATKRLNISMMSGTGERSEVNDSIPAIE